MEYLIQFIAYLLTPYIINKYLLIAESRLYTALVVGAFIIYITMIINSLRKWRVCPSVKDHLLGVEVWSGFKLGFLAGLFATIAYIGLDFFPNLLAPFAALPIGTEIGEGLYVSIAAMLGYWIGRPFVGLCP